MKNVLVTGGKGFLGQHVCKALEARGHTAIPFDIVDGYDIREKHNIENFVRHHDIDAIFNLAGILGTHELQLNSMQALQANTGGALNCLGICDEFEIDMVEIGKPNIWLNTYSITKQAAEDFTRMYVKEFGIRAWIVKWYNAYGPGQHYGSPQKLAPTSIVHALKGMPIEVFGSGEQTLDNIYVEDAANACLDVWESEKAIGIPIEVGSGEDITVNEFVRLVLAISGSKSEVVHVPMRRGEDDMSIVRADLDQLNEHTSFKQTVGMEAGLRMTIDWYRNHLDEF